MAFAQQRFVRVTSAYNAGQISTTFNPNTPTVLENGPAMFTYASADDAVATIAAANYFASVVYDLAVNDQILIVGSDATEYLQVATVDRDAGTITTVSAFPTGVVGTANINNLAVTTAKLADLSVTTGKIAANAVGSGQLALTALQYAAVTVTAAEFNGMYAAPKLLIAAGGANTLIVIERAVLAMTFVAAAYAAGGVVGLQYDSTVHGAGVAASNTEAAADFFAAASTSFQFNGVSGNTVAISPFTTTVNKGIYISNLTQAFTTGDGTWKMHLWYKVIPTV